MGHMLRYWLVRLFERRAHEGEQKRPGTAGEKRGLGADIVRIQKSGRLEGATQNRKKFKYDGAVCGGKGEKDLHEKEWKGVVLAV